MIEDVAVGGEDPVGDPVLAHELPDVLHGVQLRGFGRERHQGDVVRDHQPPRLMPAGSVHKTEGVGARRDRL